MAGTPEDGPSAEAEALDLSDPDVLNMALRNHAPEEAWSLGGTLLEVSCGQCHQSWPCPTARRIRQMAPRPPGRG